MAAVDGSMLDCQRLVLHFLLYLVVEGPLWFVTGPSELILFACVICNDRAPKVLAKVRFLLLNLRTRSDS